MFNQNDQQYLRVSIRMCDGTTFVGNIGCGLTAKLEKPLNNEASFVELIDDAKHRKFVSKSQIISVELAPEKAVSPAPTTLATPQAEPA